MSLAQVIRTIFEMVLAVFTVWAVFHEDLFIAFEQRIASLLKRKKLKVIEGTSYKAYK